MDRTTRAMAKELAVYDSLGDLDRWLLCRRLRWIRADPASWRLLLDYERKLTGSDSFSWRILEKLTIALGWYNREARHDRLERHLMPGRLPGVMQVVLVFLDVSPRLHRRYRDLLGHIAQAGDNLREDRQGHVKMTPYEFRIEAATRISGTADRWRTWNRWYPSFEDGGERTLAYLENIAHIAGDLRQFTTACQDMAPALGLEATSSLAVISRDFQEYAGYHARVSAQLKWWKLSYTALFGQIHVALALDRILAFLEALIEHPLVTKCLSHARARYPGASLVPSAEVADACRQHGWSGPVPDTFMVGLVDTFVEKIVRHELHLLWSIIASRGIRWSFDEFTEYIPYELRQNDWTVDNAHNRAYWNWQESSVKERDRFVAALGPRLCPLFIQLDREAFEAALDRIPRSVAVRKFTRQVQVPVAWERDYRLEEGYQHQVGFYDIKVEIARPVGFAPHTFAFERLSLQAAIDALGRHGKIRRLRAVRAHSHSGG